LNIRIADNPSSEADVQKLISRLKYFRNTKSVAQEKAARTSGGITTFWVPSNR